MTAIANSDFSRRILDWFLLHGRFDLPWQQLHKSTPDPYQVWVSEIMLQQTQVASVIDYYNKFMDNFPTLEDLANADIETVLENWAGLGYYARARNLHKTAKALQKIITKTNTCPTTLEDWQALSGIGKSTAGAILAMGMGQFGVICDGNVKRVLTRHFGIQDDITKTATDKALWQLATTLTPKERSDLYAQAMMDMGATICMRTRPKCEQCPIMTSCVAYQQNNQTAYPVKSKKQSKPTYVSLAMIICYQDKFLWLKREMSGIWGGLWCLPLLPSPSMSTKNLNPSFSETLIFECLGVQFDDFHPTTSIRHTLTHFHWQLSPIIYPLNANEFAKLSNLLIDVNAQFEWYNKDNALAKPTAMTKIMELI